MSQVIAPTADVVSKGHVWKVFTLAVAHLCNDWYVNLLQIMLPFLIVAGLEIKKGGYLIAAFMITSSVMQPLLGVWIDRRPVPWMVAAGTLWMAVLFGCFGFVQSYALQLMLALAAGVGTAAFHPQASAMVSSISGNRKGAMQAIFITFGNFGLALTPVTVFPLLQKYGLSASPLFVIPGVIGAVLLWCNPVKIAAKTTVAASPVTEIIRRHWRGLGLICLVVCLRSMFYFAVTAYLAIYLLERGVSGDRCGVLLFAMLFFGALGGFAGGYLSDRIGRRAVTAGSLLLSAPLFWLFLQYFDGMAGVVLMALAGAMLMASFSVTVVAAQELIRNNAALASGMMLGFGFGVGGLGVAAIGVLAQHYGVVLVLHWILLLPVLSGLCALAIKKPAK